MKKGDIMVFKTSAQLRDRQGKLVRIRRGQTIEWGHDLIKGREHLVQPFRVTYPIEIKAG